MTNAARSAAGFAFRLAARLFQRLRRGLWRLTGEPAGAHAIALTPECEVVLVRLTYAPGWRLPGGGCRRGEDPRRAALRELAEEIGLTRHGAVDEVEPCRAADAGAPGSLFVVRDVAFEPRRGWEVAEAKAFDLAALPADLAPRWRPWLERLARFERGETGDPRPGGNPASSPAPREKKAGPTLSRG